ncbi:hypothetical protein [Vibrio metschnikovii]|uniref:hypothetical protein n=1 Tax=Vibrio metschnikovii TaxID=28172 RepID=UPI001C30AD90|nr:hypothetical protein [Vibrio metschnikovii]
MYLIDKKKLLNFFAILAFAFVNHLLAVYIIDSNVDADLVKYIRGAKEFGDSYFEPLSALYLEFSRLVSEVVGLKSYLALQSTVILMIFILFKIKNKPNALIFFWLFTLVFVVPLINVRYITFIVLVICTPRFLVPLLAPLCHWNLMVLLVPLKLRHLIITTFVVLPSTFYAFSMGYLDFIILKITYYVQYAEKDYGIGIFVEICILFYIYRYLYKEANSPIALIYSLIVLSFIAALLGFPIISGRIIVLTFLISIFQLYDKKIFRIRVDIMAMMLIVSVYEIYRVFSMIGIL